MLSDAQFFELFDEMTDRVCRARDEDFDRLLIEWFDAIEEGPPEIVRSYRYLLELAPWGEISASVEDPDSKGAMGASKFRWPRDREIRLASTLSLFRHVADTDDEAFSYFGSYFYNPTHSGGEVIQSMSTHLFGPFTRDLRHHFERALRRAQPAQSATPNSSTIISPDHSTGLAMAANDALQDYEAAVSVSNSIDPQTKDRLLAEVRSGKELLKAATVRVEALKSVLLSGLTWAAKEFAGTAFGMVATAALTALTVWLGLG